MTYNQPMNIDHNEDAQRDLNAELLGAIEEMKSGQIGRVSIVAVSGGAKISP